MPLIANGATLREIASALKIKIDDNKGTGAQSGTTPDGREVRVHDGKAYIKEKDSWFSIHTSKETRRKGGRELVLQGLRASLKEVAGGDAKSVTTAVFSTAQKFLRLANADQAKNWATVDQVRTGVRYTSQLSELRRAAPGLTLVQAQELLQVSGWPGAEAATLTGAARYMATSTTSAEDALKKAQEPDAGDFQRTEEARRQTEAPKAGEFANQPSAAVKQTLEVAVKATKLASHRQQLLLTYAIENNLSDKDVRETATRMKAHLDWDVAAAHAAWETAQMWSGD